MQSFCCLIMSFTIPIATDKKSLLTSPTFSTVNIISYSLRFWLCYRPTVVVIWCVFWGWKWPIITGKISIWIQMYELNIDPPIAIETFPNIEFQTMPSFFTSWLCNRNAYCSITTLTSLVSLTLICLHVPHSFFVFAE